jgi:hypothetical protein
MEPRSSMAARCAAGAAIALTFYQVAAGSSQAVYGTDWMGSALTWRKP